MGNTYNGAYAKWRNGWDDYMRNALSGPFAESKFLSLSLFASLPLLKANSYPLNANRFVMSAVLALNLASIQVMARECIDPPLPPPPKPDVLDSEESLLRFIRLPEAQNVVINGVLFSQSGLYERIASAASRYPLDKDRDYSYFSADAISDDGRYVVLNRPVSTADFLGYDDRSKSTGAILEFYSEGRRIAGFPMTYFISDRDNVERQLSWSCMHHPEYEWIEDQWFDARTNRYYIHTVEHVLYVFDIASGAVLALLAETGPSYRARVETRDGMSLNLERFRKCDSFLALMAESSADPVHGFTGFSGPAQDGQTQSIISVPFAEILRVDVTPKSDPELDVAEVHSREGGRTTLNLEHLYSFCGVDESGKEIHVGLHELKSLSNVEFVAPDPAQVALTRSIEQEINDLVKKKTATPNWSALSPESYKIINYEEFDKAVMSGDHDRIMSFLSDGADPGYPWTYRSQIPQSALTTAVRGGRFQECAFMVNNASNLGFDDEDPVVLDAVRQFSKSGDDSALLSCMELLLEKGANPNVTSKPGPPLQQAKSRAIVELLLKYGADPNLVVYGDGSTYLFKQVSLNADLGIIEALLQAGADPNIHPSNTRGMLWLAYDRKNAPLIALLAKYGVNMNDTGFDGKTPLFAAVKEGNFEIADVLLRNGADPNHKDKRGLTALIEAQSAEVVELLAKHGADMNATDNQGRTKLDDAISWGNENLVESLLKGGADPNGTTGFGSYLMYAVIFEKQEMVKALVKYGADPNATDKHERTILESAVTGPTEILQTLLEAGANPDVPDKRGATPLERLCRITMGSEIKTEQISANFELLLKYAKKLASVNECLVSR